MSDNEIHSSRFFEVPPEDVYAAFADPLRLAQWWGPAGFTNTIHEFDLQPGGMWRMTMHGPDGSNYDNDKTFAEVAPGEKVTFLHHGPVHRFQMEISFIGEKSGTRLDWRMRFEEPGEADKLLPFISQANEENFDRLQSHLNPNA